MTGKILISACLLGHAVRYDGKGKPLAHPAIERWKQEGRLVTICPEMAGGMAVPRAPAEIENGASGLDVLQGRARVIEITGGDVTSQFKDGAQKALAFAKDHGCAYALLIDGSPSCGSVAIYDGSFSGRKQAGNGVTAALLSQAGIVVFSPANIDELDRLTQ
ncbi:purine nucleoside phosphorylase [Agrobacterium tumefaciens]|uniref:Purine nucleoside phosphorylase n=1 Tax=Agrobacterium tumefaciens TaxID=358 RepID=A0A0D0KUT4_AGRTU|nr:purine nucleoside phosphorylase [Agrobacterium tumefaciens]